MSIIKNDRIEKNKLYASVLDRHANESSYKKADYLDFAITLVMVVIAVLALRLFVFEPIRVDGDSMFPTLHNTERMLVEKVSYWFDAPSRGDIIICYYPNRGDDTFVKRVVGLPGEKIAVKDGLLYINGERYDESKYWTDVMWSDYEETTIPNDCVFVMGDNRNHSGDSRESGVGPIPLKRIVGHVLGVMWPLNNMREV